MFTVKKLSDNSKDYLNTYYEIIDQMNNNMQNVEICNSVSKIFIEQIIPHHQAGINLSNNILKYTTNIDIENLAKNVIEQQNEYITKLESFKDECKSVCNNERDINLYLRKFNEIFNNMTNRFNGITTNNNLNQHYLNSLIIYYENGINLAQNALSYGICNKLMLNEMIRKYNATLILIKQVIRNLT